ncbi:MAG: hypothetical protein H7Y31_17585 [Chitinophagaceae bacterium]|nr:hypothetical protein [Chitinophagaceae bacterium]
MQRKKPDVDIVKDVLRAALNAYPDSVFIRSLSHQYEERGGLSKKQLEGLYKKVEKVDMPQSWMATLEAVILKKPTRYKSVPPPLKPFIVKQDEKLGIMIEAILAKYPQHKRVMYFKLKVDKNEALTPIEIGELEKFHRLLK